MRPRRQRAHFDEAESHAKELARDASALVEARRHADGVGKIEAEEALAKSLVVWRIGPRIKPKLEALDGEIVRAFGIEREQQRLAQAE